MVESLIVSKELEEKYESGKKAAEKLINDPDKMEIFLQRVEQKLDEIPVIGEQLSMLPVMISFVKSYVKNDYREAPVTAPISIVAALIYLISPKDLISDKLPVIGLLDDIAVVLLAWKYVIKDVEKYQAWRKAEGLERVELKG